MALQHGTAQAGQLLELLHVLQRLRRFGRLTAQSAEDARVFVDAPVWLQRLIGTSIDGLELLPCQADAPVRGTLQSLVALRALHP